MQFAKELGEKTVVCEMSSKHCPVEKDGKGLKHFEEVIIEVTKVDGEKPKGEEATSETKTEGQEETPKEEGETKF